MYSCFLSSWASLADFESVMDQLTSNTRTRTSVVIASDFNEWARGWRSRWIKAKTLITALSTLDMTLLNR